MIVELELNYRIAQTMKFVLIILSLCYCRPSNGQRQLQALNERRLIDLQQRYLDELQCLKRFDGILSSKWSRDLAKINIKDLGDVEPNSRFVAPSKEMYNTLEEEWLLESGSTSKEIETCFRNMVPETVPLMNQAEINCLNRIFGFHIEEEIVHEDIFKESLSLENREQLPFRRFISFTQFGDLMFQSRTPDALSDLERVVYEHAESYLTTETEKTVDRTFIMEQECEWKNARALRSASGLEGRLNEFARQIKDSVNQQLANRIVRKWNLNSKLSSEKYAAWLKVRNNMEQKINAEVAKLRNEKRDAQWLCEHATKFAYKLSDEQGDILLDSDYSSPVNLEVSKIAEKTRDVEKALRKSNDFRQPVLKNLADKFSNGTSCLQSFLHLVQNHRKFDIALYFVDRDYNYPQFYCKGKSVNLGLIATTFCKCIGSFCVSHRLAALFAEEYALTQAPDGTFRVVLSGVKSREKVTGW